MSSRPLRDFPRYGTSSGFQFPAEANAAFRVCHAGPAQASLTNRRRGRTVWGCSGRRSRPLPLPIATARSRRGGLATSSPPRQHRVPASGERVALNAAIRLRVFIRAQPERRGGRCHENPNAIWPAGWQRKSAGASCCSARRWTRKTFSISDRAGAGPEWATGLGANVGGGHRTRSSRVAAVLLEIAASGENPKAGPAHHRRHLARRHRVSPRHSLRQRSGEWNLRYPELPDRCLDHQLRLFDDQLHR